ncbi:ribbon-helix-helix domain-containing protein [Neorhizobium sp. DT-125]|uniref:ribbon-helix-helix domain-containing protein n=1 Tax=Neorhizobium sp. DT-125 TaxID=3396163 RepID=UPI003F19B2F1
MQSAEKLSITMTRDLMETVRESVAAGEFATISEAMRNAVRVWQRQRLEDAERLEAIRARIRRSIDDPRPSLTAEEMEDEMAAYMARAKKAGRDAAS